MNDDDDFDYEYDPLFDVSAQCSCEDPVEDDWNVNVMKTSDQVDFQPVPKKPQQPDPGIGRLGEDISRASHLHS